MTNPAKDQFLPRVANFIDRHLLWMLLGVYFLATFFPSPGVAMRGWEPSARLWDEVPLSLPLGLLAVMLFCAALSIKSENIRALSRQPLVLVLGVVAVWLGPVALVSLVGLLFQQYLAGGLLVGLALVAAMPVANSSVGWSHNARGDLAVSLGLILATIALCPWITPNLLQVLGFSLSAEGRVYCDLLVNQFSGKFFIVWVILPTTLGFVCQYLLGRERIERAASGIRLVSAFALLLLNYVNTALALPEIYHQSQLASIIVAILLAALMCGLGMLLARVIAFVLREPATVRAPLMFGLSMKHTGLALVLAGTVLQQEPKAVLMIVVMTITQHVLAGSVQWFAECQAT